METITITLHVAITGVIFSNQNTIFYEELIQSPAQHVGGAAARHGAEAGPGPGHGGAGGVSQVWGGNISSLLTLCIEAGNSSSSLGPDITAVFTHSL